jgi:hypothetical protein
LADAADLVDLGEPGRIPPLLLWVWHAGVEQGEEQRLELDPASLVRVLLVQEGAEAEVLIGLDLAFHIRASDVVDAFVGR